MWAEERQSLIRVFLLVYVTNHNERRVTADSLNLDISATQHLKWNTITTLQNNFFLCVVTMDFQLNNSRFSNSDRISNQHYFLYLPQTDSDHRRRINPCFLPEQRKTTLAPFMMAAFKVVIKFTAYLALSLKLPLVTVRGEWIPLWSLH
jgi:hypothetical protein